VIDPDHQDVLLQLDTVGREMRGRGEHREGLSRMSSEGQRKWDIKIDWAASTFIASRFTL